MVRLFTFNPKLQAEGKVLRCSVHNNDNKKISDIEKAFITTTQKAALVSLQNKLCQTLNFQNQMSKCNKHMNHMSYIIWHMSVQVADGN